MSSPKSPTSPVSPYEHAAHIEFDDDSDSEIIEQSKQCEKLYHALKKVGFVEGTCCTKIADTAHGQVWRATMSPNQSGSAQSVIIKTAAISINEDKHTLSGQDILIEQNILKYLQRQKKCPKSIIKCNKFVQTNSDYWMVLEDGGSSLFDFVQKAHRMILEGKIEKNEWKKFTKLMFKQMVECLEFIHKHNVIHFDVSLENWLIDAVEIEVDEYYDTNNKREKVRFLTDDIQIRLCDFGLSQIFAGKNFSSNKYCGKKMYVSPEIVSRKKGYDSRKSDIWSLGICLFMMSTGLAPWDVAEECDEAFVYVMKYGQIKDLLAVWDVYDYVDEDWFDLMDDIFEFEAHRADIKDIKEHSWFKNM